MTRRKVDVYLERYERKTRMDVDPLGAAIGGLVRERRVALGMTGKSLAEQLEVPATTITAWERGRVVPGARALLRLARVLGVPAATLLPEMRPDPANLADRILRLPPSALPDLERFVAVLEAAHHIARI